MLSRDDLHEYQTRAVDFIKTKGRSMLMLDMGLGKTTSTLTAASDLLDGFMVNKILVIAPLRVANSVWKQEVAKWSHLRHLHVSVCTGTERQRIAALSVDADVYTINRENVPWLVEHFGKRWPFDFVVVDESSSFKNPSSKRFRSLRKVLPATTYVTLLTGTPSPNGLIDLWSQAFIVDFGASLGRTMSVYKQRFFESDYFGHKFTPKAGSDEKIHGLIAPFCLSMDAKDYLSLPDRIDVRVDVELGKKARSFYDEFERDLLATLPDGEVVEAISAAVLANKLLQVSNGFTYTDGTHNWQLIHNEKIEALRELVEQNDEPMLVAYNYKVDLERIQAEFPDAVVLDDDPETIDRWNNGEIRMLLAHPASAGHGLNLQRGGSLCVWFGLNWSLELYQQFNARLHRQGQDKPVRVVHIVAKGCIDERVLDALSDKDAVQSKLLKALKP